MRLPGDPALRRRQLYLLQGEPQTEMFSLRTIKATSIGLFLKRRFRYKRATGFTARLPAGRSIALRAPGRLDDPGRGVHLGAHAPEGPLPVGL